MVTCYEEHSLLAAFRQLAQNDILTEEEVAAILDCALKTVQEKARSGELPAVKIGRSWRFPRVALLQRLNEMALEHKPVKRSHTAVQVPIAEKKSRRRKPPDLSTLKPSP